jgi:hypothetical protein
VKNILFSLIVALSIFSNGFAQASFSNQKGDSNPLNNIDIGERASPSFVDIDSDGDKDCFIGNETGAIAYYKNTGTNTSPIFSLQTNANNPLNMVSRQKATPVFVDINGDGTKDCFIGGFTNSVQYFQNIGSTSNANFVEIPVSSTNHPFYNVNFEQVSTPYFVDIDADGDQDCFVGEADGTIRYYKNFGTVTSPNLIQQNGVLSPNPLSHADAGDWSAPAFLDIENDGDFDCLVGSLGGTISYYKNTGTSSEPIFTVQTGADNPFSSIAEGTTLSLGVVDIDNDGRTDCFVGNQEGLISYFKNMTGVFVPVELQYFTADKKQDHVLLQWATATERNTSHFELEKSANGKNFTPLSIQTAKGSNSYYTLIDKQPLDGINYYRLLTHDFNGTEAYSKTVSVAWLHPEKAKVWLIAEQDALNIGTDQTSLATIRLLNTAGQVLAYLKPQNAFCSIPWANQMTGIYLVEVTHTEGVVSVFKVFKK